MKTLVTGGVKSGKSRFALKLAMEAWDERWFLATATAIDSEMEERIRRHQEERGANFTTIEEPIEIDRYARDNLVLDCVTVWTNNVIYYKRESDWLEILDRFLKGLGDNAIIVTNETGWGNIPENPLTRRYNRMLGLANGIIAEAMDEAYLMVSNIPVKIK